jgi:hypothetical protein
MSPDSAAEARAEGQCYKSDESDDCKGKPSACIAPSSMTRTGRPEPPQSDDAESRGDPTRRGETSAARVKTLSTAEREVE